MIYLKEYKELNLYYWEISSEEFAKFHYPFSFIPFNTDELDILSKLDSNTDFTFNLNKEMNGDILEPTFESGTKYDNTFDYILYKLNDEWYLVKELYSEDEQGIFMIKQIDFYRCDQIDGLIKLLKDKLK